MDSYTNAFKQGLVGTYTNTDTAFELDSIVDTVGSPAYLPDPATVGNYPIIIYDSLFGNPADSNNAGDYEILTVTAVNYTTNTLTVTRGAENTTAQTISGGDWVAVYGLTSDFFNSKLSKDQFTTATAKADFTDTDSFLRWDSVSTVLRKFTWANLLSALGIDAGNWTPVDESGAGLTLLNLQGHYVKVWKIVVIIFRIDYPTTSNTNQGRVGGQPFVIKSMGNSAGGGLARPSTLSVEIIDSLSPQVIRFVSGTTTQTNAELSEKSLRGTSIYFSI